MLVKGERTGPRGIILGISLIAVGLAAGVLRPWETWGGGSIDASSFRSSAAPAHPAGPALPAPGLGEVAENGLAELRIELDDAAATALQRHRNRSLKLGLIIHTEDEMVPATIGFGDLAMRAEVRLKGDQVDHINTHKWSLRIELEEGSVLGMRRFSIQHPRTRGYLLEWLMLRAARHEGLLAPRATFVNVVVNGDNRGVYYLEEHFSKELLESQGRREGPIVRFEEDTVWASRLRHRTITTGAPMPPSITSVEGAPRAVASAFGEGRLARVETLNRQWQAALARLDELRNMIAAKSQTGSQIARLQAAENIKGKLVEDVIQTDPCARMHALTTLFRREHGLYWHNLRFYYDPVTDRLEPIVFDASSGVSPDRDPIAIATRPQRVFLTSSQYYVELFQHLHRFALPTFMDAFIEEIRPEIELYEQALKGEGILPPEQDSAHLFAALRDQQIYLLELVHAPDPVNFEARWLRSERTDGVDGGVIEVSAWATTSVPVSVESFMFSNGRTVRATSTQTRSEDVPSVHLDNAALLPSDGRRLLFRFPIDERLTALRRIEEETAVIRGGTADPGLPDITIRYRTEADGRSHEELLELRRFEAEWAEEGARPPFPSVAEALERHPFLTHNAETGTMLANPGEWRVVGDLVLPAATALVLEPGTHLLFEEGAIMLAGAPVHAHGAPDTPVVLDAQSPGGAWGGLVVLDADGESRWEHVVVRRTGEVRRGGWMTTGGVTFYRSPATMLDCAFEDARGEDALNVFGASVHLERVRMSGSASDAFDGDFVTGEILDCDFEAIVADAVDVSGSRIRVADCRFVDIGDKCISAGEASTARVESCRVSGASIAVASKDNAQVVVDDFSGESIINYGFAAYTKKPEYGPSSIRATDIDLADCGRGLCLAQTRHEVLINGKRMPEQDVDVAEMYSQKILGQ